MKPLPGSLVPAVPWLFVLLGCGPEASPPVHAAADGAAAPAAAIRTEPGDREAPVQTSAAGAAAAVGGPASTAGAGAPPAAAAVSQEGEQLLRRSAARYAAIRSMRASFAMETRNPLLRETVRSRGELFQRRPDRILLRFEDPAGDVIVSDGRFIWVWYPSVDSMQVLRTPAAAGAGGVDLLAQFVGDPTERFAWTARGPEDVDGRPATILALDPRGEETYRQLVVWIDRDDQLVRRFEITEHSGVVRRIDLQALVIDPALPDSLFRFTPPPGARIVGGS
jgi:outer membrane lipoprotein carrier protein